LSKRTPYVLQVAIKRHYYTVIERYQELYVLKVLVGSLPSMNACEMLVRITRFSLV